MALILMIFSLYMLIYIFIYRGIYRDFEIKLLEKALDFAPIQIKINELELRYDFEDFSRKMKAK